MIIPFSSFNSDSPASAYPACSILFHADDFVSGSATWASRAGDLVLTLSAAALKDSDGVYASSNIPVSSVAGTMPVPAGYVVPFIIGKTRTNSDVLGVTLTIGSASGDSIAAAGTGLGSTNNGIEITDETAISTDVSTNNSHACRLSYFDWVTASNPPIYAVFANDLNEAIDSATGTTADTNALPTLALDSAFTIAPLTGTTNAGSRCKAFGLFMFDASLTLSELKIAAAEMARTQELFGGWRNRT